MKIKKIEWYEPDGVQGGQRGLSVDLVNKKITKWNGAEEKITCNNIGDVKMCIDNNINSLNVRLSESIARVRQKGTETVEIENGYKTIAPLSETQKYSHLKKQCNIIDEISELKSINLQELTE